MSLTSVSLSADHDELDTSFIGHNSMGLTSAFNTPSSNQKKADNISQMETVT